MVDPNFNAPDLYCVLSAISVFGFAFDLDLSLRLGHFGISFDRHNHNNHRQKSGNRNFKHRQNIQLKNVMSK